MVAILAQEYIPFSVLDSRSWAENPEHFRELLVAMGPMGHLLATGGVGCLCIFCFGPILPAQPLALQYVLCCAEGP